MSTTKNDPVPGLNLSQDGICGSGSEVHACMHARTHKQLLHVFYRFPDSMQHNSYMYQASTDQHKPENATYSVQPTDVVSIHAFS